MTGLRTRLVCTLATPRAGGTRPQDGPTYVEDLVAAGMDVARVNLSHSMAAAEFAAGRAPLYDAQEALLRRVRAAEAKAGGRPVGVLLDLQGTKVRLRLPDRVRADGLALAAGEAIRVTITRERVPDGVTCDGGETLVEAVREGLAEHGSLTVAIGDGDPFLRCEALDGTTVVLRAPEDCRLDHGKGVTFRGVRIFGEPPLTEKDEVDLAAFVLPAISAGLADFVALSFVQGPGDVAALRAAADAAWGFLSGRTKDGGPREEILARLAALRPDLRGRCIGSPPQVFVVAKIETAAGAAAASSILREADCVMVARGDLGLHEPPQDVPAHQKRILREARWLGKPGIVATQMLESMLRDPEPRRSEATDVFNAVLDGADAVMLSGETASGLRPVEATRTLQTIAAAAEAWRTEERGRRYAGLDEARREVDVRRPVSAPHGTDVTDLVTCEAVRAAESLGADAVVAATRSGQTARSLARFDPTVPLFAIVPDERTARRLTLVGSVRPVVAPAPSGEEALRLGLATAVERGWLRRGARVVVASARPEDPPGVTTTLSVRVV